MARRGRAAGRPIHAVATELDGIPNDALRPLEKALKLAAEARARKDGMSHVRLYGKRIQLTVSVDKRRRGEGRRGSYLFLGGDPARAWAWKEYGVAPHQVGQFRSKRGAGGKMTRAIATPLGPRIYSSAPGIKRKGTWSKFVTDGSEVAEEVTLEVYDTQIRKVTT